MNSSKVEQNIQRLMEGFDSDHADRETFIYDLLLAYGLPKASITRLHKGDYNLSKKSNEILWKNKLLYQVIMEGDLHEAIERLNADPNSHKQRPRFLLLTDFRRLLSIDTKTEERLDIAITELPAHFDFFLPWAGMEKTQYRSENPADIKAAERLGRLYDLIVEDNQEMVESAEGRHALNTFLTRLLFCFFAEDTGIFAEDQFTNAIGSHTSEDGSDLQSYLEKLFRVLSVQDREGYPKFLSDFPYVNGGLFSKDYPLPRFSAKSRKIIIESGGLNWKEINPDIFGSMLQAVVHSDQRGSMGMHYTSVRNIMKVIEPLFLNDLHEQLDKAGNSEKRLTKLLDRLYHLRIFDPACGSGNFLIITYKELCRLEIEIYRRLNAIRKASGLLSSNLNLSQFYGIELDDFAHETAKLSLWLTQHQMNLAFREVFGDARPTLPLEDSGHIVCRNATRLDWEAVCPKESGAEVYVLGNPPYLGFSIQDKQQKADLKEVWGGTTKLDYISIWFLKAGQFIQGSKAKFAFVTTNSINQGEQVGLLWPHIFNLGLEIFFGHTSFKWTNNAKGNAGVTCTVVGIENCNANNKILFTNGVSHIVPSISPYLTGGGSGVVHKRRSPLSVFPTMLLGDMAKDGGHLVFSADERKELVDRHPESRKYLKRFIGAIDFIRGVERWCLWVGEEGYSEASTIPPIKNRFDLVSDARLASKKKATQEYASKPYRFVEIRKQGSTSIIIPTTSSERRPYIPMGFVEADAIVTAPNQAIYDPPTHIFAILSSRIHMTWVRAVAGRLKTDYRYSSALCYNTFPFPSIGEAQKTVLEDHVFNVLDEREKHPEKTMAQLYDPDKMPEGLRQAHHEMDMAVEQCYRSRPFKSDEERLEYLFKLYEEMIEAEKQKTH